MFAKIPCSALPPGADDGDGGGDNDDGDKVMVRW